MIRLKNIAQLFTNDYLRLDIVKFPSYLSKNFRTSSLVAYTKYTYFMYKIRPSHIHKKLITEYLYVVSMKQHNLYYKKR